MNKKLIAYVILPVLAFTIAGTVSAHGSLLRSGFGGHGFGGWRNATPEEIVERQNAMYQHKADLLGVSVDTIKDAWAEGKSLLEMAEENGLSEEELRNRMLEQRKAEQQEFLQTLIDNGVITQAQADRRLEVTNDRLENGGLSADKAGKYGRGLHHGFGMGFRF